MNVERHDTTHHSAHFGIKERCDQLLDQSAAGDVVGVKDEDHFGFDQRHGIFECGCFATLSRSAVERVDFDELVKISDFISIHTPLMPATHHLFNADVFSRMKPSAYLINTARGPIIDEAALAQALDMKQIAGAALDVMEKEPPGNSAATYR